MTFSVTRMGRVSPQAEMGFRRNQMLRHPARLSRPVQHLPAFGHKQAGFLPEFLLGKRADKLDRGILGGHNLSHDGKYSFGYIFRP